MTVVYNSCAATQHTRILFIISFIAIFMNLLYDLIYLLMQDNIL